MDEHLESLSPTATKKRSKYLLKIYKQKKNGDKNESGNNDLYLELKRLLAELVALDEIKDMVDVDTDYKMIGTILVTAIVSSPLQ
ncbi:hypothetical protein PHYBLDRAFT_138715 [Phycomyces blakesleeanus NRRL 1555(-)]|uniref:Uncharacterized protein n=1 Tax=Phycomyces blakesleeanus (strain ATCC 8743b / DSM 1359 / FGSC 10004 / NBRC 33097 / NRRL 1555) TaxID=763407 RepID=A0A167R9N0_PHYB8|nr:hypothetical protein PHYBLDRAFT_138715 [Phycomyces blakesleeanus NRRL 1555(-)]OAD81174.1 hypothetical protein PHYBLDRAFT_138715 [Phycomyces blakesleeanus NRRL 1555(-)]|eukprot:XP_018299214.1 hypothetical protein PHYBLDRAFT_138715 [Phycomyces blakesleeanus NRRL 1555(-)]